MSKILEINYQRAGFFKQEIPIYYTPHSIQEFQKREGITEVLNPDESKYVYTAGEKVFKQIRHFFHHFCTTIPNEEGVNIGLIAYQYLPGLRRQIAVIDQLVFSKKPEDGIMFGYFQEVVRPENSKESLAYAKRLERIGFGDLITERGLNYSLPRNVGRRSKEGRLVIYDLDLATIPDFLSYPPFYDSEENLEQGIENLIELNKKLELI